jgi:HEPN domain-containing protein
VKALYCKNSGNLAPRNHNIIRLLQAASISIPEEYIDYPAEINTFNIEGRYPNGMIPPPTGETADYYFSRSSGVMTWLKDLL